MDYGQPQPPTPGRQDDPVDRADPVDPDLALLEAYLDGELTAAELLTLQQRLRADAELSGALARLSDEYTVRQAVFTSLEGTNAETERVARAVAETIDRATAWDAVRRYLRAGAVAAACVVCFAAGWVGRGSPSVAAVPRPAASTVGGPVSAAGTTAAAAAPLVYQVALTDVEGNITAVQRFDSLGEAQNFAADVSRWQAELQTAEQPVLNRSGL